MENPLSDKVYKERMSAREEDIRGPYFRDQTAIIHSLPFRRLKNKTQVFFAPENDHICTRIEHVLHVSTISATICKGLGLDVELAQAIALGHDLGHAPFGHSGEKVLDRLNKENGGFIHELHGLRIVDRLTRYGNGLNLTYGVRDGIVSHYGEEFTQSIEPFQERKSLTELKERGSPPTTYEGCVVRMADKIAYFGRDIEDAIKADLIEEGDIPGDVRAELGTKNGEIIDVFVKDLIEWSGKNGKIGFSPRKFATMQSLRDFNYSKIYNHERLQQYSQHAEVILNLLFDHLLGLMDECGRNYDQYLRSSIPLDRRFGDYLRGLDDFYGVKEPFDPKQIALDYIAGMTDQYSLKAAKEVIFPDPIKFDHAES
ncbi:HD domain-containing protein [Candidatus Bipolaricaulota bacterium]|nr:HD domain-containing protein [Candidatus Bipolaricaulota bacterium]